VNYTCYFINSTIGGILRLYDISTFNIYSITPSTLDYMLTSCYSVNICLTGVEERKEKAKSTPLLLSSHEDLAKGNTSIC